MRKPWSPTKMGTETIVGNATTAVATGVLGLLCWLSVLCRLGLLRFLLLLCVLLLLCLLFGLSLLFVVLLLCVGRINGPENGKQNCYAENSN